MAQGEELDVLREEGDLAEWEEVGLVSAEDQMMGTLSWLLHHQDAVPWLDTHHGLRGMTVFVPALPLLGHDMALSVLTTVCCWVMEGEAIWMAGDSLISSF